MKTLIILAGELRVRKLEKSNRNELPWKVKLYMVTYVEKGILLDYVMSDGTTRWELDSFDWNMSCIPYTSAKYDIQSIYRTPYLMYELRNLSLNGYVL